MRGTATRARASLRRWSLSRVKLKNGPAGSGAICWVALSWILMVTSSSTSCSREPWLTCQSMPLSGNGWESEQPAAAATACR